MFESFRTGTIYSLGTVVSRLAKCDLIQSSISFCAEDDDHPFDQIARKEPENLSNFLAAHCSCLKEDERIRLCQTGHCQTGHQPNDAEIDFIIQRSPFELLQWLAIFMTRANPEDRISLEAVSGILEKRPLSETSSTSD